MSWEEAGPGETALISSPPDQSTIPTVSGHTSTSTSICFVCTHGSAGEELPGGIYTFSSAAELKAALKEWGLPISGKKKAELWQRLVDQVGLGRAQRDTSLLGATGLLSGCVAAWPTLTAASSVLLGHSPR